jgi:hypothetical protein
MNFQMMRVISSPSISTTGFFTLILTGAGAGRAVAISAIALPDAPVVRLELGQVMVGEVTIRLAFDQHYRAGGDGLVRIGETVVARLQGGARTAWPCIDDVATPATWRVSWWVPGGQQVIGTGQVAAPSASSPPTFRSVGAARQLAFAIGAFEGAGRVFVPPTAARAGAPRFLDDEVGRVARALEVAIGATCWPRDALRVAYVDGLGEAAVGLGVTLLDASLIVDDDRAAHEVAAQATLAHALAAQCFGVRRLPSSDEDGWLTPALAAWAAEAAVRGLQGEVAVAPDWRASRRRMLLAAHAADLEAGPETLDTLRDRPTSSPLVRGRGTRVIAAVAAAAGAERWRAALARLLTGPARSALTLGDFMLSGLPRSLVHALPLLAGNADVPAVSITAACLGGELTALISSPTPLALPMCLRSSAPGTPPVCTVATGHESSLRLPGSCANAIVASADGEGVYQVALDDAGIRLLGASVPHLTTHERASLATDLIMQLVSGAASPRQVAAVLLPARLTDDARGLDEAWCAMQAAIEPGERARFQRWLDTDGRKAAAAMVPRAARTEAAWARATDRAPGAAAARARQAAPALLRADDPTADVDATLWLAAQRARGTLLTMLLATAASDRLHADAARAALAAVRDPAVAKVVLAWALARGDADVAATLVARVATSEPLAVALAPQVEAALRGPSGAALGVAAGWACRSPTFASLFTRLTSARSPLVELLRPSYQLCTMVRAAR